MTAKKKGIREEVGRTLWRTGEREVVKKANTHYQGRNRGFFFFILQFLNVALESTCRLDLRSLLALKEAVRL